MAELYEDWVVRPLTRAEMKELSPEEKKERRRLQMRNNSKKNYQENREEIIEKKKEYYEEHKEEKAEYSRNYREEHTEELAEYNRKYYEENVEKEKERHRQYKQTPTGKKVNTISNWKSRGLQESKEDLDRIYDLWLHQELCNACDVKLTRNGDRCSTDATMDHDHITHRFRHVICRSCNTHDKWKEYFC